MVILYLAFHGPLHSVPGFMLFLLLFFVFVLVVLLLPSSAFPFFFFTNVSN